MAYWSFRVWVTRVLPLRRCNKKSYALFIHQLYKCIIEDEIKCIIIAQYITSILYTNAGVARIWIISIKNYILINKFYFELSFESAIIEIYTRMSNNSFRQNLIFTKISVSPHFYSSRTFHSIFTKLFVPQWN